MFLLSSVAALAAVAQPYRTFSVWSGNGSTDFSLVTTDSFAVVNDSGPMVVYKDTGTTDSIDIATIDSITVSAPNIASTNKRTVTQLKAEFDKVSVNKSSYKAVGNNNPLMGHKFGSARCVELGSDMISIVGTPQEIRPPYLFEDAGINKVGGKYLYSYCANFNAGNNGPCNGNIGYMKSDSPLDPFTYVGRCFDNPGNASWSGGGGNNHHAIVEFKGKYYILYHNRSLKSAMMNDNKDITSGMEVRSTCISEISVDTQNATITPLTSGQITQKGVTQLKNFDPYQEVPGATMAWERGITTKYFKPVAKYLCTAEATKGSWIGLSNVDFGSGAIAFTAKVKGKGIIKVCTSNPTAKSLKNTIVLAEINDASNYSTITVPVIDIPTKVVSNLYIVFSDEASLQSWSFIRK